MGSQRCMLCGRSSARRLFRKQSRDFLRCRECALVWIDPMPQRNDRSEFYEASYREGHYVHFASAEAVRRMIAEHRLDRIRELARPGRWLDIGCAGGEFVAAAKSAGFEAEGLEISRTAVERARARNLCAHHAAVEDFEPAAAYDTITAFDTIEHLVDPRSFLVGVRHWLAPDGTLALTLPDMGGLLPRILRRHWFYYWPDDHLYYFRRRTISRLLGEAGFRVLRLETAHKLLNLEYAAQVLREFNPRLGSVFAVVVGMLPRGLRTRRIRVSLGELLVIARRDASESS